MFYEKTSVLSKTMCSHVIFFKFFMKNPLLSSPYTVKKRQNCQNYTISGQKNIIGCPSFLIFHGKIIALISNAYILSKIFHSLKITCSYAHIMSKKHPFSQKQIALISFLSKILIKKLPAFMPIFGQKNVNSNKITHYDQKSE